MASFDTNIGLYNPGRGVSPNFNFMLRVEGMFDLPCRRVYSFTKENEYEYIQEGGLNDYVHIRRKQVTKPFTFRVERYVGVDYLDPLGPGTDLILPVVLMVWRQQMNANFTPFRTYTFTGCTVMSKEYGELNAEQSGLLIETTTIAYRELMRMTMPDGLFTDSTYNFKTGENRHAEIPVNDKLRIENDSANVSSGPGVAVAGSTAYKFGMKEPVNAASPANDKARAEQVLWDGSAVPPVPLRANQLEPTEGEELTASRFAGPAYDFSTRENRRAASPENDMARAAAMKDNTFGKKETTYAASPENDKTHAKQKKDNTFGKKETTYAASPKNDKNHAVLKKDNKYGKTETTYAASPENDADRAEQVLWDGSPVPPVPLRANQLETTEGEETAANRFAGPAYNFKTQENRRAASPKNDKDRPEVILWNDGTTKPVRAMMAEYLSGR